MGSREPYFFLEPSVHVMHRALLLRGRSAGRVRLKTMSNNQSRMLTLQTFPKWFVTRTRKQQC